MPDAAHEPTVEERLIVTAERMFADRGVGAVSLRAVMQEAGTNVAAVHYHFGSKQALLDAIVRSRVEQVAAERGRILRGLPAAEHLTAADLAEVLLRPAITVLESGGQSWLRLLNRLLGTDHRDMGGISDTFLARNTELVELYGRLRPAVPPTVRRFRLTQAMRVALDVLCDLDRTCALMSDDDDRWTRDDAIARLLEVVTSILLGPPAPG
ncbi:TetR/AcrR family transcriptional regulator [Actinomadura nitritigenes]|uniref:TetR/AcrR family transcriptional regulator n=1 Tax=Actinomadura nitritigenes TaxID=134602 RepID=UPI003D9487C6